MTITVIKPGLLTTIQDQGRRGQAALGIGHAGPMDGVLHDIANALVGNAAGHAALEITLLGPRLHFGRRCIIALCGDFAQARTASGAVPAWRSVVVDAGTELDCGALQSGMRGYLAVSGGIAVEPVLGSRATDINARLGPLHGRAVAVGDELPLGTAAEIAPRGNWSVDPRPWFDGAGESPIHCIDGPHRDWLDDQSLEHWESGEFRIGTDSNRVGVRLEGTRLRLSRPLELISEPVCMGTVQLPPGGQPIILTAEHPTTGGYPRIAQIAAIDLGRIAQRRIGASLRFVRVSLEEARTRYRRQQRELAALLRAIHDRLRP